MVLNEFDGLSFHSPEGALIPGIAAVPPNIANGLSYVQDFLILLGVLIGFRIATFFELLFIIRNNCL